ncbi:MAG: collagen-like protein [Flavobacteriaceae bacterium]
MKKISILVLLLAGILTSCEGDIGPQGPPGFDGLDGADGLIGSIFEVEADFSSNEYEFFVDIPSSIEVFDTDVVMAYILSGVDNDVDIWEPLPQTLFFGSDILLYGYDYTFFDVRFFLDGTIDLNSLDPLYTDNIIFRVAVIPADFAESINTLNLEEVMGAMNINNVERVD